jgi:hypothetical protein
MREPLSFESKTVLDACAALSGWQKGADPFRLFVATAKACAEAIAAKRQKLMFTNALRGDPSREK